MEEQLFRNRVIDKDASLLDAFKKMDILDKKLLLVQNKQKFLGLISAGDIQRAIIQNKPLETKISEVLRKIFELEDHLIVLILSNK